MTYMHKEIYQEHSQFSLSSVAYSINDVFIVAATLSLTCRQDQETLMKLALKQLRECLHIHTHLFMHEHIISYE